MCTCHQYEVSADFLKKENSKIGPEGYGKGV
jgi:hypothetical protein